MTLGAPFWFDVFEKVVIIRTIGEAVIARDDACVVAAKGSKNPG
jgi:hypothetical protein